MRSMSKQSLSLSVNADYGYCRYNHTIASNGFALRFTLWSFSKYFCLISSCDKLVQLSEASLLVFFLTKQREGGGGRVYVKEKEHSWWVRGGWFWRNPLVPPPALPFPCLHGCYRSFTPEPVYPQNTAIDNTVLCIVYTGPTAQKRQMFSSLMSIVTFVATSIGVPYVVLTFTVYVVGAWENQPVWQKYRHAQGQGYQHIHIKYSKKEIFFQYNPWATGWHLLAVTHVSEQKHNR